MMEVTGMSYRTLDRVLRRLISYGEIIVRGNNRFSIITVCDYDGCDSQESLFGTTDGIADGTTDGTTVGTAAGTTHLSTIEGRRKKEEEVLVSPYSSYKKDKEGLAYEIKDRWNRMAEEKLNPVQRLTMPVKMMVMTCMERCGKQSIDLVFEQVLLEHERTGFVASFQFVFELVNYQGYLKRAQQRLSKKPQPQQQEPQKGVGVIEVQEEEPQQKQSQRERFEAMVDLIKRNPDSWCRQTLEEAYRSGKLKELGIDWKPNNE